MKFAQLFSSLSIEKRILSVLKTFLSKGLYTVQNDKTIRKTKIFDFFSKRLLHIHFVNGKAKKDSFVFELGLQKAIVYLEDNVLCIPLKRGAYNATKDNFLKFYNSLTIPKINIYNFDDKNQCYYCERIDGQIYDDRYHDNIIINLLFEYSLVAKINIKTKEYIQHGDAKRKNIIWNSYASPLFLDLDDIGFKPILFDLIHYCVPLGIYNIQKILSLNAKTIRKIYERFQKEFDESNYMDEIFFGYVNYYLNNNPGKIDDYLFIKNLDSSFPRTLSLFKKTGII